MNSYCFICNELVPQEELSNVPYAFNDFKPEWFDMNDKIEWVIACQQCAACIPSNLKPSEGSTFVVIGVDFSYNMVSDTTAYLAYNIK